MKNLLIILTVLTLLSCNNKTNKESASLIGLQFKNFKEINKLANYTKVSDTAIFENNLEPKHGILHLRNQSNNLVLFKKISYDSNENRVFKIADTLVIKNLNNSEFITIGYYQKNKGNDENLIAIVDKTDSLKIKNIKKLWRANTTTNKIEVVNELKDFNCFNEWSSE